MKSGSGLALYGVTVRHHGPLGPVTAVDRLSLDVPGGTTVGLVGESGSGKSTLARAVVGLDPLSAGRITVGGREHGVRRAADRRRLGRQVQLVFQDPDTALDPRMTVRQSIAEAAGAFVRLDRRGREQRVGELLELVGLDAACADRLPRQLSGGQRQRVAVARALAVDPAVLIADEVTSALDMSVRAAVLTTLRDLQRRMGFAMLFISHDLAAVRQVADAVAVMYLGRIVETAATESLLSGPRHPYTRALLSAVPSLHAGRRPAGEFLLAGEPLPRRTGPASGTGRLRRTRPAAGRGRSAASRRLPLPVPGRRPPAPGPSRSRGRGGRPGPGSIRGQAVMTVEEADAPSRGRCRPAVGPWATPAWCGRAGSTSGCSPAPSRAWRSAPTRRSGASPPRTREPG